MERTVTTRRVGEAGRVVMEGLPTDGRIADARCVGKERIITKERVGAAAAFSTSRLSHRRKRESSEHQRNEK
jgi:hypothetical protein